jgi:glycosyltransferase involved in cell wall biosynthesis/2-polyprenyl-3-methyl-5-hydroxy-6-metoxy-1,4-benzoquinol methylase
MAKHKLDMAFLVAGMELYPDIMKEKSLGGSETAGIEMAHAMARRGHNVKLFCNTKETKKHEDVSYHPLSQTGQGLDNFLNYVTSAPVDVVINQRIPQAFSLQSKAKHNVLWQHDFATVKQRQEFNSCLWNVDQVFCLSDWQINQYKDIYGLDNKDIDYNYDMFFKTSNGISEIPDYKITRKKKQLVFTNRPERGMDTLLLQIMPAIWKQDKDVELVISGYDNTAPQMVEYYEKMAMTIANYARQGFKIKHAGHLTKEQLYKLYQESTAFIYPTMFYETSCITAMESQACGLPMITTNRGALPETLCQKGNILIEGPTNTEKYTNEFVDAVFTIIEEHGTGKQDIRKEHMKKKIFDYNWDRIAEKWEKNFLEQFKLKTEHKYSLYEHLLQKEDIMTLRHAMTKHDNVVDYTMKYRKLLGCQYSYIDDRNFYRKKYQKLGAEYILKETVFEPRKYPRTDIMLNAFKQYHNNKPIKNMLDFGAGIGNEAYFFAEELGCNVDCVNISAEENEGSFKLVDQTKPELLSQIKFITADEDTLQVDAKYDGLHLGEILEHQPYPSEFMGKLVKFIKKDSPVVISVPVGLWEDERQAHLWNFERRDLQEIFGEQDNLNIQLMSGPYNNNLQDRLGWFVVSFTKSNKPFGHVNLDRKLAIQSPRETISTCIITKDEENEIGGCLESVKAISNEIIVGDTGNTDNTNNIVEKHEAIIIKARNPKEYGFDEARNDTIEKANGSLILWIDADERLMDNRKLIKYLRRNPFNGYSIKQVHHTVDPIGEPKVDMPIRLFRNNKGIKFYGFVHEHPEIAMGRGVGASMICSDVLISHTGYLTETIRRDRFKRNIPMMFKDREKYPDRLLGKFLMLRDWVHMARYAFEENNKQMNPKTIEYAENAIKAFDETFLNDNNMYQDEAIQFYSEAMAMLNLGHAYSTSTIFEDASGKKHTVEVAGRFKTQDDFNTIVNNKLKAIKKEYDNEFI